MRQNSRLTVAMLIVMAFALLFYTLASELRHRTRYGLAMLGTLCMAVGVAGAVIIQVVT